MNESRKSVKRSIHTELFPVVEVIGHVRFDPNAGQTPNEAAFELIARMDREGTFEFPHPNGSTVCVSVEYRSGANA